MKSGITSKFFDRFIKFCKALCLPLIFFSHHAFAQASLNKLPIELEITDATGNLVNDSGVSFQAEILNPGGTCIVRAAESFTGQSVVNGIISFDLGTSNPGGVSIANAISNTSGSFCAGAYTPAVNDGRILRITVSGGTNFSASVTVSFPLESVANSINSQNLGGKDASLYLYRNTSVTAMTQSNLETLFAPTAWTNIGKIVSGDFAGKTTTGGMSIPAYSVTPGSATAGSFWYDSVGNVLKYHNGSAVQTLGTSAVTGTATLPDGKIWVGNSSNLATTLAISGDASLNNSGVLTLANSGVTAGTYTSVTVDSKGRVTSGSLTAINAATVNTALGYTPLNSSGDSMSGTLNMNGNPITSVGSVSQNINNFLGLSNVSSSGESSLIAGWSTTHKGRIWYNSTANSLRYWDGSSVQTISTGAGSWVSSISTGTGLTGGPITSSGTISVDTGTTANKIVQLDSNARLPAVDGSLLTSLNPSALSASVPLIKGGTGASTQAGAANAILPSQAGNSGKVLMTDGSNVIWSTAGGGTVTNVTGTSPISVSNGSSTPVISITTAGVSSGQTLRYNGSAWEPKFLSMADLRSTITGSSALSSGCTSSQTLTWIAATDNLACTAISIAPSQINATIPAINGGTGLSTYIAGDLIYASGISTLARLPAGTANLVLTSNGPGTAPSWQTPTSLDSSKLPLAGGTMSGFLTISSSSSGTLFSVIQGGSGNAATFTGKVGIGTSSPSKLLDVVGEDARINGVAIGKGSGTGSDNTLLGSSALASISSAIDNTAIGSDALLANTIGSSNTAVGRSVLATNTSSGGNTGVGSNAIFYNTGANNTALGGAALKGVSGSSGGNNTAIGYQAGNGIYTGFNNTFIGYQSGSSVTSGSNNVVIGSNTGSTIATASNTILLSDGSGTERVRIDSAGNMGVGIVSPTTKLDVNGSIRTAPVAGTLGDSCTGLVGSMRYNTNTNMLEVCANISGGKWVANVPSGTFCGTKTYSCGNSATSTTDLSCAGNPITLTPSFSLNCSSDTFAGFTTYAPSITNCPYGFTGTMIIKTASIFQVTCIKN